MASQRWLSLNDYAIRHNVSISTLRRRIRDNTVAYRLQAGKYYLLEDDEEMFEEESETSSATPSPPLHNDSTQVLLGELKHAFRMILEDKDQQILRLEREVADLRTLARVLEERNKTLIRTPVYQTSENSEVLQDSMPQNSLGSRLAGSSDY